MLRRKITTHLLRKRSTNSCLLHVDRWQVVTRQSSAWTCRHVVPIINTPRHLAFRLSLSAGTRSSREQNKTCRFRSRWSRTASNILFSRALYRARERETPSNQGFPTRRPSSARQTDCIDLFESIRKRTPGAGYALCIQYGSKNMSLDGDFNRAGSDEVFSTVTETDHELRSSLGSRPALYLDVAHKIPIWVRTRSGE